MNAKLKTGIVIGAIAAIFVATIIIAIYTGGHKPNEPEAETKEPVTEEPVTKPKEESNLPNPTTPTTGGVQNPEHLHTEIINESETVAAVTGGNTWAVEKAVSDYVFQKGITASQATCLEYQGAEEKIQFYFVLNDEAKTYFMVVYDTTEHTAKPAQADIEQEQITTEEEAPLIRDVPEETETPSEEFEEEQEVTNG